MTLGTFASKSLLKSYVKIEFDKKILPWYVFRYDIYPTRCVFSIPLVKDRG